MKKKLINLTKILLTGLIITAIATSCTKEDKLSADYSNGVFIINEGSMGNSNSTISFYNSTTDKLENDIFQTANSRPLGDIGQSITIHDSLVYIVVNGSGKIEVVDRKTFSSVGVISNVPSPRYFVARNNTGYISCWGDNSVKAVNLNTLEITASVTVGTGPEKMLIYNNELFVCNSGGWGTDSSITVININTMQVTTNIETKYTPSDLVICNNALWVLCYGKVVYDVVDPYPILEETASKLYEIDPVSHQVQTEITLFNDQHPAHLEKGDNNTLLFGCGYSFSGIYSLDLTMQGAEPQLLINEYAYGMDVEPATGIIFVTLSPLFTGAGQLKRYDQDGTLLGTYTSGIGPKSSAFSDNE